MPLSNMCRKTTVLVEIEQNTDTLLTKYLRVHVYERKRFAQELFTKCEHVSMPNKRFLSIRQ
jgi:hypothetical protein